MISAYSSFNSLPAFGARSPVVEGHRMDRQPELNSSSNRRAPEQTHQASSTLAMSAWSASENREAEIQVRTREGDVVTIRMQQTRSEQQSAVYAQQTEARSGAGTYTSQSRQLAAYSQTSMDQFGFSLQIEGDLNDDEKQALADLINNMNEVSTRFFNGDIASAFKQAQKLGFDQEQIAGFSMNLNRERSVQAVSAYQQVESYDSFRSDDLIRRANDFLADSRVFLADTQNALASLAEPQQAFQDLFEQVTRLAAPNFERTESSDDPDRALLLDWINRGAGLHG